MTFYLYVIHFDDFFYYVGKRKCPAKYNPWNDPYTGSPKTHKNKWSQTKFKKVVLECFDNDKDVSEAEKNILIELDWENDPYCLNECCGGKFSYEANKRGALTRNRLPVSEETKQKMSKRSKKMWEDPNFKHRERILKTLKEQSKNGSDKVKNSPEIRQKISNKLKGKMIGEKNSQYGTKLIFNLELKQTKRIGKNDPIPNGWKLGAIYNFDSYFEREKKIKDKKRQIEIKKKEEREEKINLYTEWYEIYQKNDFKTFCELTGYSKSQQNLCDKFKTFVSTYYPKTKNGRSS
jgi:hypothetical protein